MGGASRAFEERFDRGWSGSDNRVCAECLTDYALKVVVQAEEVTGEGNCLACDQETSAPFDVLLEAFVDGVNFLFEDALNSVMYVSAEGGFVGAENTDSWDLMEQFEDCFETENGHLILEEIRSLLDDKTWVNREDPDFGPEAMLGQAWQNFCNSIKYESRFVFWLDKKSKADLDQHSDAFTPASALHHVGELIEELHLYKSYEAGDVFFRSRTFDKQNPAPSTSRGLGTSPAKIALQGNRMSPAGIPMFYASESEVTALAEVSVRMDHNAASVGTFASTREFNVVDLTDLPPMPSPFDTEKRDQRWMISFLNSFVDEISQPIELGRDQVDYVPTQVMTEYLLRIHESPKHIDGIRFHSAAHRGGINVALDIANENFIERNMEGEASTLQMQLLSHSAYQADVTWTEYDPPLKEQL